MYKFNSSLIKSQKLITQIKLFKIFKVFLVFAGILTYFPKLEARAELEIPNNKNLTNSSIEDKPVGVSPSPLLIIKSNVTLQKCKWANFSENILEILSADFSAILSFNSRKFLFNLSTGETDCLESKRLEIKVPLVKLYQHLNSQKSDPPPSPVEIPEENWELNSKKNTESFENATSDYYENPNDPEQEDNSTVILDLEGILTEMVGSLHLFRQIQDYCLQNLTKTEVTFSVCENPCITKTKTDRPCIPKCCPIHKVVDFGDSTSISSCGDNGGVQWTPKLHDDTENENEKSNNSQKIKPYLHYSQFNCQFVHFIHENAFDSEGNPDGELQIKNFRILKNGDVVIKEEGGWVISNEKYCLDGMKHYSGRGEKYSGNHAKDLIYIECINPNRSNEDDSTWPFRPEDLSTSSKEIVIYMITIPFASIFLILTIVVYILLWDTHNIHGYTLFSYVCSLFGFYIFLFFSQIRIFPYGSTSCAVTGAGIHLFFLMTACWLTTINYDVWSTFRHLKAGRPSQNLKKYLCYASLACGVPATIVFISAVLNNRYKDEESPPIIIPNYGKNVCALSNASVGYYLYTPVGILIGCNIMFFIWTILILLHYQRSIGAALKGTSSTKEDQSLRVFVKLFIVMGTSWVFEIIGWAVQRESGQSASAGSIAWFFALLDVLNVLLAVAIFFIFVWKKVIYDQLWYRYPCLRGVLTLCILGGCTETPRDDRRPSGTSAYTMSTMQRTGTVLSTTGGGGTVGGRKISSSSVSEMITDSQRKISTESRSSSIRSERQLARSLSANSRTSSLGESNNRRSMSTLSETEEEDIEDVVETTIKV